jgi:nitrate/nitrite-specific signal transduction histidine kinase
MDDNRQLIDSTVKESLSSKIFIAYLIITIGIILCINLILFINNLEIFRKEYSLWISIGAVCIIYAVFSLFFWLVARKLIKPFQILIKNISSFLEGNWEQRTYLAGNDEANALADGFNAMADEISNIYLTLEHNKNFDSSQQITRIESNWEDILGYLPGEDQEFFYQKIANLALDRTGSSVFILAVLNPESNTIHIPFAYENNQVLKYELFRLGKGLISTIIKTRKPLVINSKSQIQAFHEELDGLDHNTNSFLGVPITHQDQILGAMAVLHQQNDNAFVEQHAEILQKFASIIGMHWEIERLNTLVMNLQWKEEKISDISGKMLHINDMKELVRLVGMELLEAVDADEIELLIRPSDEITQKESTITSKLQKNKKRNKGLQTEKGIL